MTNKIFDSQGISIYLEKKLRVVEKVVFGKLARADV